MVDDNEALFCRGRFGQMGDPEFLIEGVLQGVYGWSLPFRLLKEDGDGMRHYNACVERILMSLG